MPSTNFVKGCDASAERSETEIRGRGVRKEGSEVKEVPSDVPVMFLSVRTLAPIDQRKRGGDGGGEP